MATCLQSSRLAVWFGGLWLGVLAACEPSSRATATIIARVHAVGGFVSTLAFDDHGGRLLAAADGDRVSVWGSVSEGAAPSFIGNANGKIANASFSPTGTVQAVTTDGAAIEWDVSTQRAVFSHRLQGSGLAAHSPDGRYWALGGALFDRTARQDVDPIRVDEQTTLQFSASGTRLLSIGRHPTLVVVRDLSTARTFQQRMQTDAQLGALNSRGDRVAVALRTGEIEVFQMPDFQPLSSWWGPRSLVALQFLEDNEHLVVVSADELQVRDARTSWTTFRSSIAGSAIAFALDHGIAAAGTPEGKLLIWDLDRSRVLARAQIASSPMRALAVSALAHRLAVGDEAGAVTVLGW